MKENIQISFLQGTDTLVIRKGVDSRVFVTTDDSIIIGRKTLITIFNYLVGTGIISPNTLLGILEEFNTE